MAPKLAEILKHHEADLKKRVRELIEQLGPLEAELADVRRAQAALTTRESEEERRKLALQEAEDAFEPVEIDEFHRYRTLSMKQLTITALSQHFEKGATAQQLLAFFRDAYGRGDVIRSSLSPQLTRLKRENKIYREGLVWKLVTKKKTPSDQEGVLPFIAEEESVESELSGEQQPQTSDNNPS